jgi:hypothetical protein
MKSHMRLLYPIGVTVFMLKGALCVHSLHIQGRMKAADGTEICTRLYAISPSSVPIYITRHIKLRRKLQLYFEEGYNPNDLSALII